MASGPCRQCGAPVGGLICAFCGSLAGAEGDRGEQERALDEFHRILGLKPAEDQAKLLGTGYVPEDRDLAVKAGLRCIPLIGGSAPDPVKQAAVARLKAIVVRLKIQAPDDAASQRAVREFEAKIEEFGHQETRDIVLGCGVITIGVALVGLGIYALARWLGS